MQCITRVFLCRPTPIPCQRLERKKSNRNRSRLVGYSLVHNTFVGHGRLFFVGRVGRDIMSGRGVYTKE
jgi:hypothetical protein